MPVDKGTWRIFLLVIVICAAMFAASNLLEWRISSDYPLGGGEASTSYDRIVLANYELDTGDTIYYEYEASEACWFVIYIIDRADPLDIRTYERLNLSGTQNAGSFECPVDGQYSLRVTFLEIVPEEIATVNYYTHALNDSSVLKMVAETVIVAALTAILIYIAYSAYRWEYGGFLYKVFGAAGGMSLTAFTIALYLRPSLLYGNVYIEVLSLVPGVFVALCFWGGLFTIAWEEEGESIIRIGSINLPLVKLIAVVVASVLVFGFLMMIYVFIQ
ncbi:MAG: hypothetical protein JSU93_00580 [Methanobacteriota archaeon]|nr:MAG: hypothetical protein JSU93_00580 [Euryarchaeota archaeon]